MRTPITTAQAKRNFVSPYSRWHRKDALPPELNTLAYKRLREPLFAPAISPGFKIEREDKIFAIGSCFARGVELALIDQKMDVLSKAVEFDSFPTMNGELALGFTNKYNTFSIHDELRWALDPASEFPRESLVDLGNGIFCDPHVNPALQLVGLEETIRRREIMQMVTRRIAQCRVVIITLGLVEVWRDKLANVFINHMFPALHSNYPDRYELHVTNFVENLSNLERIHALLNQFGHQDVQIVVTVSPVPLVATFSGEDVVIANTYSKSLLRTVAQEWAAAHKNVHYFPSYEIVLNSDRNLTWAEDMRHVKGNVVQHIMRLFVRNYCSGLPLTSCKLSASPNPLPPGIGPGKTTITWFCHGVADATIYVSGGSIKEAIFAHGPLGAKEAPWIEPGATYKFILYADRERNTPLAQVSVTRPTVKSAIPQIATT
jgi:hypothetical protein